MGTRIRSEFRMVTMQPSRRMTKRRISGLKRNDDQGKALFESLKQCNGRKDC
jgi:hypothetical protein